MKARSSFQKYFMATLLQPGPVLWVAGVQAIIAGYVNTPGFTKTAYSEDLQRGTKAKKDGVAIVPSQPTNHEPYNGPQLTDSLYLFTNGMKALWQVLKDTPPVYYGLETFEYGRKEFAVKDGNGHILQFGQDVPA